MSGLDGLGWPNPEDEPKTTKTMSDTPETDALTAADQHHLEDDNFFPATVYWRMCDLARTLERERDEWKAKFLQQNKDLGCELRDPNGTIWSHAATLERERDEAIKASKSAKAYKRVLKNENARLRRMLNLPENANVLAPAGEKTPTKKENV
jgi:hypothetical protein